MLSSVMHILTEHDGYCACAMGTYCAYGLVIHLVCAGEYCLIIISSKDVRTFCHPFTANPGLNVDMTASGVLQIVLHT